MSQDSRYVLDAMVQDRIQDFLSQLNESALRNLQLMPPLKPSNNSKKESVMQSEQMNELATALSKAQGEMQAASKDVENTYFKSKYADLGNVWMACRAPLSKNGLSVIQTTRIENNALILITTLMHSSGQWMSGHYPINPIKNDPQGMGSAVSYARRYALSAIVGAYQAADDDDDGEGSMDRSNASMGQPAASQGEYRVPFGKKHIGKSFEEMGYHEVKSYLEYLEESSKAKGDIMKGDALIYCNKAEIWLGNYERMNFGQKTPDETI